MNASGVLFRSAPSIADYLGPFRRRILVLNALHFSLLGSSAGAVAALALITCDYFGLWDSSVLQIAALAAAGGIAGAICSLTMQLSETDLARSIDRRSGLDDRLTTAVELPEGYFGEQIRTDLESRMSGLSPAQIYPLRLKRQFLLLILLLTACATAYVAVDTRLFTSAETRRDAAELKQLGAQVEQIARPIEADAKTDRGTPEERTLVTDLKRFAHDLQRDRMTRQEALLKASELAAKAQEVEQKRSQTLSSAAAQAQTAGEKLQEAAQLSVLQKSDAAKAADQERALQQKIDPMQQALSKQGGLMTLSERQSLQKQVAGLQKSLQQLKLSDQAQETLAKLESDPDFQAAQKILQQLQQQSQSNANGQQTQLTQQQLDQMALQLEQLAKSLDTDAKMKAYAQAVLEAAKQARLGNGAQASAALLAAFGMSQSGGQSSSTPATGLDGKGGTTPGVWDGGRGKLDRTDRSSLLNIKFRDQVISSQQGKTGSETYTEETGPSQLNGNSGIPYQSVLPKYEKTAETALSKGNIPPEMRGKVRDYFDALRQ